MKKLATGICMISLIGLSDIHAQEGEILWRNDPTYSVYNYKHPNKAAAAKKLEQSSVSHFTIVQEPVTAQSSTSAIIQNKRIFAWDKNENGKTKIPLAIRRKAAEKVYDYVGQAETENQHMED